MEEIKDRIKLIMEKENLSPREFSDSIGIQQSTLSHILNNRNNPSLDVVMKIHEVYDSVNYNWLLNGSKEMTSSKDTISLNTSSYEPTQKPIVFNENEKNTDERSSNLENRKEIALGKHGNTSQDVDKQVIRYIEKPARKITEIRIFFDDNTYETFKGDK
ncbi:MAG: helix-turn-helix domain-containing protein [Bacteroidaceae bacterium]|nr:helix-turn-helix domain-containing protein [Bacteroidaceae bacterium]